MKVGTLDSLMALGDEIGRADAYCEGVVRKTERQVVESYYATKAAASGGEGGSGEAGGAAETLRMRVNGTPVGEYIKRWTWDRCVPQYWG